MRVCRNARLAARRLARPRTGVRAVLRLLSNAFERRRRRSLGRAAQRATSTGTTSIIITIHARACIAVSACTDTSLAKPVSDAVAAATPS
eukprot:6213773-Pleurochrysis_carterae.AAC.1